MKLKLTFLLMIISLMTACFNEENRYIAYLEKDGTIIFTAYVENVYSIEESQNKRKKQEKQLLSDLNEETNIPLLKLLEENGAENTKIIIIHETIPFAYVIKTEFDSFEEFLGIFTNDNNNLSFDVDVNINKKTGEIKIKNSEFNSTVNTKTNEKKNDEEEIRVFISGGYNIHSDKLTTTGENSFILNSTIFENATITWNYEKKKKKKK